MTVMTVATRVRRRSSRERIVCDSVSAAVGLGSGPAVSGRGAGTVAIASYSTHVSLHPVGAAGRLGNSYAATLASVPNIGPLEILLLGLLAVIIFAPQK